MATTKELNEQIARLNMRLITLKDELTTLRQELNRFRTDVASDVNTLSDALKNTGGSGGR
tara:strand:+ start:218 stop:397 length:180 start_codon:yes stop_codon:yes gene_type:complete